MTMREVMRSEVEPGQVFYCKSGTVPAPPCIALDGSLNHRLKKAFYGGAGKAWHVYVPTGSVTWTDHHTIVLVEVKLGPVSAPI